MRANGFVDHQIPTSLFHRFLKRFDLLEQSDDLLGGIAMVDSGQTARRAWSGRFR